MKVTTFVPHLIIVCCTLFKNTLSNQSCPSLATDESTHRIKDHSLVGHVILNTTASTKGLCFFKCTRECRCTSFNYQPNGHNACELNDEDDSTHPEDVQPRPGVNYYKVYLVGNIGPHQSVDCWKWCCESDPCLNGGTCDITCGSMGRIQCLCPKGFSGKLCEIKLSPSKSSANVLQSHTIKPLPSRIVVSSHSKTVRPSSNLAITQMPSQAVASSLDQKVIFSTSKEATPLPYQVVNPSRSETEKASSSEAVIPSLTQAVTFSRSQAVKPSPGKAVTTLQGQAVTSSPNQAVTTSSGQTVTTLLSQADTPSRSHVFTLSTNLATTLSTLSLNQAVSLSRSCSDIKNRFPDAKDGEHTLYDNNDSPFSTHCQFESKTAWTLVMSYALAKNKFYQSIPLSQDNPRSGSYNDFRLSLEQMKSVANRSQSWRWTCNVRTKGLTNKDRAQTLFEFLHPLTFTGKRCIRFSYINVRGSTCRKCTARVLQTDRVILYMNSNSPNLCQFKAAANPKPNEQSFGRYLNDKSTHKKFSCTSRSTSTTEMWFGGQY